MKNAGTYKIGVDKEVFKSRPQSYYIKSLKKGLTGDDFSVLSQAISADKFKGKRIRFSALIKAENIKGTGFFFADLTGLSGNPEPVKGTTDWKRISSVFYVPQESKIINFGISLYGEGHVWMDDVNIETVAVSNVDSIQTSDRIDPINLP